MAAHIRAVAVAQRLLAVGEAPDILEAQVAVRTALRVADLSDWAALTGVARLSHSEATVRAWMHADHVPHEAN